MRVTSAAVVLVLGLPGLALASGVGKSHHDGRAYLANGQFTYEIFEATVEHADLEGCSAEFDPGAVFCRVTIASDLAHIFAYSHNGNQPLLAAKSY